MNKRFIVFAFWLLATSVILLTPRDTVRSTSAAVKRQPVVQVHKGTPVYRTVDDGDNWHLFWFFGLGLLAMMLPRERLTSNTILIVAALSLYSLATELIQEYVIQGRAFQWYDLLMNQIGIVTGTVTATVLRSTLGKCRKT